MGLENTNPQTGDILADDPELGACGACALPLKIARYGKARSLTDKNAIYARSAGFVKEAAKLENCSNYLLFRHYHTVDQVRLHSANFCKKHLLCPMCAIRRGAKMLMHTSNGMRLSALIIRIWSPIWSR